MPATKWEWTITSATGFWNHSFRELWSYRYLLAGLVRRNFILNYQQTILGPLWIMFQPILTLITYVIVFNKIVGIPTGSLPPVVFYAAGIVLWNFFNDSFIGTASTFKDNAQVFSKVYFPRVIVPVSVLSTQFLRFLIQMILFLLLIAYYVLFGGFSIQVSYWLLAFPFAIVMVGAIALGLGLLFSVLTAKYRDMSNLVSLGVRLLMFVTPVIYPMVAIPEQTRWIVQLNPLTPLFELFRLSLLGEGIVSLPQLLYSLLFTFLVLLGAVLLFNKQGDRLIDVV